MDGLAIAALRTRVRALVEEIEPEVVVGLGLCPGEPVIGLERIALNLANFEIPDNEGLRLRDDVVRGPRPGRRPSSWRDRAGAPPGWHPGSSLGDRRGSVTVEQIDAYIRKAP